MIKKLAIFGVGLIGGSLALALKRAGHCELIASWAGLGGSADLMK